MTHIAVRRSLLAGALVILSGAGWISSSRAGGALLLFNAYQTPPASQEAEELRQGIQKLLELERKLKEEEAARKAGGEMPPVQPAAIPATQPAAAAPVATAPGAEEIGPPANLAVRTPATQPAVAAAPAGEELVGPPANFRLYRPQRRPRTGDQAVTGAPPAAQPVPAPTPAAPAPVAQPVVPADGKTEWFNFAGVPWEDVVKHFAERLDKPLHNEQDIVIGGELTYVNPNRMTVKEAIDELNMLMQEVGWRFVEVDNYIEVIPLSEMPGRVPVERTYPTREAYVADLENLMRMDWIVVYYKPENQPAGKIIDTFSDALPDYARISELQGTNKIKLVGTVRDINRFFDLVELVSLEPTDPRQIKVFEIQTNAAEVERMVRDLLDLPQSTPFQPNVPRRVRNPRNPPGVVQQVGQPQESEDLAVIITADERTNSLIVKATPAEMAQVEKMIKQIDIKPNLGEFKTEVVPILYADAAEVARVLTSIFQQEQGQASQPNWQAQRQAQIASQMRNRRMTPQQIQQMQQQNQQASPESIIVEGIFERAKKTVRIAADERTNSLIVYANDDGQKRVRDLLKIIDVEVPSNFATVAVVNTEASRIYPMVDQIAQGMGAAAVGRGRTRGVRVVLDDVNNALHVMAEREDMNKIRDVIRGLDVAGPEMVRHVVYLEKLLPSKVAPLVQQLLTEEPGVASAGSSFRGRRGGGGASGVSTTAQAQVIPLDEAQLLIVVCKDEDWQKVAETIQQWDSEAVSDQPQFVSYEIHNADATRVAAVVDAFYRNYQHPVLGGRGVVVTAQGNAVMVHAIEPAQQEIQKLIERLDVADLTRIEVLRLQHADAGEVAEQAQRLFGGSGGSGGGGRGRGAPQAPGSDTLIDAEPATNSLIVKSDSATIDKIKDFALAQDMRVAQLVPEQRFYTLQHAKPRDVAQAVNAMFGSGGARSGGRRGGNAQRGSAVNALETETQVIVEAPADKHEQIANFIEQLDNPEGREVTTTLVKMPGAPVNEIANMLRQSFRDRVQNQKLVADFNADKTTETILMTVTESLVPEVEQLIEQYKNMTTDLVMQRSFFKLKYAAAEEAAQWLKPQLEATVTGMLGTAAARQVQVQPDTRTGRVVVYGPQAAVKEATQLLAEYDVDVPTPPIPQNQLRTIPLTYLDAQQTAGVLQQVFQDKVQKQRTLQITPNPGTNTIVVRGTSDQDFEDILGWIQEQDQAGAGKKRDIRVIALENSTTPDQIINVLNERFRQRAGTRGAPGSDVAFQAIGTTRIVANAPADQMEEIEGIVKALDLAVADADLVTEFFRVEFVDPNELANVVRQFYAEGRRVQTGKSQNVYVAVANNTLLVRAPASEMEQIRAIVEEANTDAPSALEVASFDLKVMSAENVAQQVNFFLATLGTNNRRGEIRPFAYGEPQTNTLVVGAPRKYMPFIRGLIGGIESKQIPQGEPRSYPLQFVRAEQASQSIQAMLDAKVNENEAGRRQKTPVKVVPEPATNRLFIYAPQQYQNLAGELVAMVDSELETGEVVRIVSLERGDATQLAQTLTSMQTGGRLGQTAAKVQITADEASNSIILRGLPKDVAEVQKYASALEEKADYVPDTRIFELKFAGTSQVLEVLEPLFTTGGGKGSSARPATIVEDEDRDRLIITATKRQMSQIETIIQELDVSPYNADGSLRQDAGKQIYFVDVYRGDAFDIAWEVRDLFPSASAGGPDIDSDWDGRYIKVKCRPGEFPAVMKAIREVEARAKVDTKVLIRNAPPASKAEQYIRLLDGRVPGVEFRKGPVQEEAPESLIEVLRPDAKQKKEDAEARAAQRDTQAQRRAPRKPNGAGADARWRRGGGGLGFVVMTLLLQSPAAADAPPATQPVLETASGEPAPQRPGVTVVQQGDRWIITGPENLVSDVEDAIDLIEEDLTEGQVIRIFEFTYGDVNAAAEVLNIMFNDRQANVNQLLQQQQLQQQQAQQQQRQRQQQQQGDRGGEERGQQGGGGIMDQIRGMVGGGQQGQRGGRRAARQAQGAQRIKIATDASHNYLIVKCDESDLPEIRRLLRELDIPPGESDIRVFQLVNIDATEAAQNIKEVLKIDRARGRSGAGAGAQQRPGAAGQDMLQMLQAEMMSVPGVEGGAKIESVEIVPNKVTNSLLVSAEPEAMRVIEQLIETLEDLEGRDVVGIYYYDLQQARAEDVLPLLREIFDATSGGSGRGTSPAAMGPVTLSADPRGNRIIYTAQAKDTEKVRSQIETLDVKGQFAEAETQVLQYGNASAIAETVSRIFEPGATGGPGAGRGGASATEAIRIAAEPATNSITVWGPVEKRNQIFRKVREFEEMSRRSFRDISVIYADAEDIADKLNQMFGGARTGRGAGDAAQAANAVVIIGDDNAKKLLVKAPDAVYQQIEALVTQLDQPNESLKFRTFRVKHADAGVLVERVKGAFIEYMAQLPRTAGGKPPFDPFTAVADPRTNSVTVVGSEETLAFVGKLLGEVDLPTPTEQLKQFRVFGLDNADAVTVADAINAFAQGGAAAPSGGNRGGGRPGLTPGGSGGAVLAVSAVPEPALNAVMVYGKPDDIDIVEQEVIHKIERLGLRQEFETLTTREAPPSQVVAFVQQFFDAPAMAEGGRPGQSGPQQRRAPRMIPNDATNQIIVRGSEAQIEEVRDLVARFDSKTLVQSTIKIRKIKPGRDVRQLADEAGRIVNEAEQQQAALAGRTPRNVILGADEYSNAIIIAGDPGTFGQVDSIIDQLETLGPPGNMTTRVIQLVNLSSEDAESAINQLQSSRRGAGGSTGRVQRRTPGGGGMFQGPFQFPGGFQGFQGGGFQPGGRRQVTPGQGNRRGGRGAFLDLSNDPTSFLQGDSSGVEGGRRFVATTVLGAPTLIALFAETPALAQSTRPRRDRDRVTRTRRAPAPATQPADAAKPDDANTAQQAAEGANQAQPARGARDQDGVPPLPAPPAPPPPPGVAASNNPPAAGTQPAASALPGSAAMSGVLEGDVAVQPLGSKQIIVTGNEQDLAFIEQMLRIMEQSAPQARIEIFTLQNAKAAAISDIVNRAMQSFVDTGGGGGPEDRFSITAEAASNSLIVSASDRNMEFIAELIQQIDQPNVLGEMQFKLVLLQNALASQVVQQVRPALERLAQVRKVPAEAAPSVQPVERSNGVLIIGTPKDIDEVTQLVEAMDIQIAEEAAGSAFTRAEAVLIPLQNAVAEDVAKTLTDLIKEQQDLAQQAAAGDGRQPYVRKLQLRIAGGEELPELDLEKPIRVIAEKGTNSLIVFSAPKNIEPLRAIVRVFDTLPAAEGVLVRSFVLQHARAEGVAELLTSVFNEGKGALRRPGQGPGDSFEAGVLPPLPSGAAARGLPFNVSVAHDARSNTVVLIGQQEAVQLGAALISEVDKPTAQLGIEPHIIELKNVAASKLAERVTELLEKRQAALGAEGNEARDSAVVIPEDRSNLLVVFATQEMFEMIDRLARDLDTAPSYTTIDTRLHVLEFADAAKLQRMLQELFDAKKEAEPGNEPKNTISIQADARTNSLVLTGTRDYLAQAEELIVSLDRAGFTGTVEAEVIPVEFNNPANVARLIQEMVDKSRTEESRGTPVYLTADPVSRSLLVTASREDMQQIRRWVDLIDKPAQIGITTAIVPLQRGSAEEVATRVDEVFKGGGSGGAEGETGLSISHDPATNSVVVVGPPALVREVQELVQRLDTSVPTGGAQVRIFRLEQADSESAAELLNDVLSGSGGTRAGGGGAGAGGDAVRQVLLLYERRTGRDDVEILRALRSEIIITADPRTNSLVVTAPPASMPLIESLIAAIDVPPASDRIEVFPLRNSDAQQMAETLQEIFEQQARSGTGRTGGGGGTGQAGDEQRQLTFAGAGAAGREQVRFSADIRTNSVIAAGTPGYLRLAEELIYRLDTQPIEDRKTIVYAPRNIVATELAASIRDYSEAEQQRLEALGEDISAQRKQEREITAIDNEDANRVILSYSPRFEGDVLEIIRELDQPPPQVSIETLIVEVTLDNSLELGLEFAFQDLQFTMGAPNDTTNFDFVGGTDVGAAGSGGLGGFTFAITGQDFNFLFRTLQSEGRLQVLSRPHIVAMDNQEAVIKVVDDVPYVSGTSTSIAGQVTTQVNREEVGITLEVTPQINPDGFVRMEIRQEVSNLGTSSVPIAPGLNAPTFFRREAETVVTVRDGETVMLGGLITHRQENTEQKVPLVGDVPLLGTLFRSQRDVDRKTELLVILTPRVIRGVEDFREESIFQRDRSGTLPGDILSSPFMNRLRVKPEELEPPDAEGVFGPFDKLPPRFRPYSELGAELDAEPPAPPAPRRPIPSRTAEPQAPTYDVPLPTRSAAPANGSKSYDVPVPAKYAKPAG